MRIRNVFMYEAFTKFCIISQELKADRGVVVTEVSEEEADVQRKLVEASSERKALRRELLQLESSQREVELKIHTCTMRLNRMKIIAFASQRLDKVRCRTIAISIV